MSRCVVVGSGAREHALAWAISKSVDVVVTPGNAGIAASGITCVATPATELEADLFVIGPEHLLVAGLADDLRAQGKMVFGPGAEAAQLEGSKSYMKEFLAAAGVPTAAYGSFSDAGEAVAFLESMRAPFVIKTDGLAAGKGVLVTDDINEARRDIEEKLSGVTFGDAGTTVVIEEGLIGEECSFHVLCDGTNVLSLTTSQDFKRVGDHDEGANTGGMGAYAPMNATTEEQITVLMDIIIAPTLKELHRRGIDYRGVFYAGVMLTASGPKLLEYNVRFGDPETQVLMPLYGADVYDLLLRTAQGRLHGATATSTGSAVTIVLAAKGYPTNPIPGSVIDGLGPNGQLTRDEKEVMIFHAGTALSDEGDFVANGGRVMAVTGFGRSVTEARTRAYEGAALVNFEGGVRRSDIALVASKGDE